MLDTIPLETIGDIALQASDPDWLAEYWEQGDWFGGAFQPLVWRLTRPGVVLLLGGPLTLALWTQTESTIMPAILLTLFMGLMLGGAPAGATIVGYILVVGAAVIAIRSVTGVGKGQ
jgi:hypothetical protein